MVFKHSNTFLKRQIQIERRAQKARGEKPSTKRAIASLKAPVSAAGLRK